MTEPDLREVDARFAEWRRMHQDTIRGYDRREFEHALYGSGLQAKAKKKRAMKSKTPPPAALPPPPPPLTRKQKKKAKYKARKQAQKKEPEDEYEELQRAATTHCATVECPDAECFVCGLRDCPKGEILHYHHDGCPVCDRPEPMMARITGHDTIPTRTVSNEDGQAEEAKGQGLV